MDNEVFYKLLALGWNTKDDVFWFFDQKYNIHVNFWNRSIEYYYKNYKCTEYVQETFVSISSILKLFKTVDGKVIGPDPYLYSNYEKQEWT